MAISSILSLRSSMRLLWIVPSAAAASLASAAALVAVL